MQDNNLNNPNEQDSIIDVPYTSEPKPEDEMNQEEATDAKETAQPRANKDIPLPPYIEPNGTYYLMTVV